MINIFEVHETNKMIEQENLDVRTITLGISLLDCIDSSLEEVNRKVYEKISRLARNLVSTGDEIEKEYGIPIVNKRISIKVPCIFFKFILRIILFGTYSITSHKRISHINYRPIFFPCLISKTV